MNSSFKMRFSNDLYHARYRRGLTQQETAELSSVSLRSYQRFESGSTLPTVDAFLRLIRLFGLNADDYMEPDAGV